MTPRFLLRTQTHLLRCLAASLFLSALFACIYFGADYVTSLRAERYRIDFAFEKQIPFVPELSIIYSSFYLMFLIVAYVLRDPREMGLFTAVMASITLLAGLSFLLLPAEIGFEIPAELGWFPAAFAIADWINLDYNLCPSLHVAYSVACAEFLRWKIVRWGWGFHGWAFAVAIAAWLTYQHHLVDLLAGYMLSLVVCSLARRTYYAPSLSAVSPAEVVSVPSNCGMGLADRNPR